MPASEGAHFFKGAPPLGGGRQTERRKDSIRPGSGGSMTLRRKIYEMRDDVYRVGLVLPVVIGSGR